VFLDSYNILFTNEEIISGAIMLALAVSGIGQATMLGVSIKNIIGVLIIILFAYNKGPSMGAAVGVTIGLITTISSSDMPLIISILGVSGLLSGLFKELGAIGSSLGFVIGNGIMILYINGFIKNMVGIKETIIAAILFTLLSPHIKKISSKVIVGMTKGSVIEDEYSNRIKNMTYKRLKEFSLVFEELGSTFKRVAEKEKVIEQKDISKFVDVIAGDVCKNCAMYRFCWEDDFYSTYQSLFDLMNLIEFNGNITMDSLPEDFIKRCIKQQEIIEKTNYSFDLYKLNYKWENKILESRQLVASQLEGVSKIINELAGEIHNDLRFKEDVEKAIYSE